MNDFLGKLPIRFQWTLHNLVAHPVGEILYQLGFENLNNRLHDATIPTHVKGSGRG
jgi:hypothetical protein